MSGQMRMTPETMRQRAGEYTTQANNLDSIIRKMDSLLNQLQAEWEGDSSRAYAEKFAQLRPSFVSAKELIDEISKALTNTAKIVESTDQNIANQFRQ